MFIAKLQAWIFTIVLLAISSRVVCQDACADSCSDYNGILVNCQSDSGPEYDSCVCNDPNFQPYVAECITCEGTNSDPYQFQQNCKTVPADCTDACSGFAIILENCGDTSDPGFGSCICSSAYDETYSNTFNQDFQDCVTCENGGGQAADWEAYCCAQSGNCVGMSPAASSEAATISVSRTTTTSPVSSPTQINSVPSATSSGVAGGVLVNTFGLGLGQIVLNAAIAIL